MIYDRTCRGRGILPGLTHSWIAGAYLYGGLGRLDSWFGAASWDEALRYLATFEPGESISEIQFWGHGNWGNAKIDGEVLDVESLQIDHPHHELLTRIRERLTDDALWWFRTCETFGTAKGQQFARAFADFMNARIAGHTYVIAWAQSGLHTLGPGETPSWSIDEGLGADRPPTRALWSHFNCPNTISFLTGRIPKGY